MRRPLLWGGICLAVGVWTPTEQPLSCWAGIAIVAFAGAVLLALTASRRALRWIPPALIFLGFFATGKGIAHVASQPPADSIAILLSRFPELFELGTELTGRVIRRERRLASRDHLLLDLDEVRLLGRTHPIRGRVGLLLPIPGVTMKGSEPPLWVRGDRLAIFARLRPRRGSGHGSEDATGQIKSLRLVSSRASNTQHLRDATSTLLRGIDHARDEAVRRIRDPFPRTEAGRRAAAVALSLVLGERADLTPDDLSILREAGLSHLLAVSGFNVAVLAAAILFLLKGLRLPLRAAQVLTIPLIFGYLALNRMESSVVRAVAMASVWLAGRSLWRRAEPLNLLGCAAIWILFRVPGEVHDVGFQLTFVATASLIVLVPPFLALSRRGNERDGFLAGHLRMAAVVTLAALLGTLPLTVVHFHRISPGAFPANLLAGPLMAGAFVSSLALSLIPSWCSPAPELAARAITGIVDFVFFAAEGIASLPGSGWARPDPPSWTLILYGAGLASFAISARVVAQWNRAVFALRLLGMAGLLVILLPLDSWRPPEGLKVTALDVGQGDAILIESPGGARVLVDAGRRSPDGFDAGERLVAPALWRRGITSLDLLVVTHADADHAGGAAAIIRRFRPSRVWLPASMPGPVTGFARLLDAAADENVPVAQVSRGDALCLPGVCLSVLSPPEPSIDAGQRKNANEHSLVLSVRAHGRTALLMGDTGIQTEQRQLGAMDPVDVLKVGHHGSRSSSGASFLARIRPKVALVSCGRGNRFGHPHPSVLSNLAFSGARICRTDSQGEVGVELIGNATRLSTSCVDRDLAPMD